ncbi:FAD-dependent oxidoreductase [Streptomyces sp. KL118A]|uniref:FAD-dependent oxidoreductase n=1 Tax=Streptomyces sp. KL118A TaxID=3045153 RepID=UPI00278C325F|nr:FAD-dependent oxidoreductase [Streptomyces sp. KL118A]
MADRPLRCDQVVIGAGFAGLHCAAALADAGFEVTVLERASEPMAATSRRNWGRIHHGWHFAGSLATALESISCSFDFLEEFADLVPPVPSSACAAGGSSSWVALAHESFTSRPTLVERAEAMRAHYADEAARRSVTFGPAEDFFRPLPDTVWKRYLSPGRVHMAASTLEPFVDLDALADRTVCRAQAHPRVTLLTGHEVAGAAPAHPGDPHAPVVLQVHTADGTRTVHAERVVNASWCSRAALDAAMAAQCRGASTEPPSTYRLKVFLRLRLPSALRSHPSCMVIHGPFTVFRNLGDGTAFADYAPVPNLDVRSRHIPGTWHQALIGQGSLPGDERDLAKRIVHGGDEFVPGLAASTVLGTVSGVLYNPGDADIHDPSTAMHHRLGTGVKVLSRRWLSLDTGKLTWVPRLTHQVLALS